MSDLVLLSIFFSAMLFIIIVGVGAGRTSG
jgi:hypothetical protein